MYFFVQLEFNGDVEDEELLTVFEEFDVTKSGQVSFEKFVEYFKENAKVELDATKQSSQSLFFEFQEKIHTAFPAAGGHAPPLPPAMPPGVLFI